MWTWLGVDACLGLWSGVGDVGSSTVTEGVSFFEIETTFLNFSYLIFLVCFWMAYLEFGTCLNFSVLHMEAVRPSIGAVMH